MVAIGYTIVIVIVILYITSLDISGYIIFFGSLFNFEYKNKHYLSLCRKDCNLQKFWIYPILLYIPQQAGFSLSDQDDYGWSLEPLLEISLFWGSVIRFGCGLDL